MTPTTLLITLSLAAAVYAAPIVLVDATSRALGDGTVNVARNNPGAAHDMSYRRKTSKNTSFELVNESSRFSIGKRTPVAPIEYLNDPAVRAGTHVGTSSGFSAWGHDSSRSAGHWYWPMRSY